jgi:aspartyl-tRNA(Asn)/glutamyl-tRNA(Gln) amidotransferase subunit A
LSSTLDAIGPLAWTVEECAQVHAVISGQEEQLARSLKAVELRVALPTTLVLDDMDANVARAFGHALSIVSKAGVVVSELPIPLFLEIQARGFNATIQAAEAFAWHEDLLARRGADYDPKVRARVERGSKMTEVDYVRALGSRQRMIAAFDQLATSFDALLLPTVPIIAPTIADAERNEDDVRARLIRNPSLFNFLDCPAASIPIHAHGEPPVGLMIVGRRGKDWRLLSVARTLESLFISPTIQAH